MATYKAVFNDRYLYHANPYHDPKNGQFTYAKGLSTAASIAKQVGGTTNSLNEVVDRFGKTKKQPRADLSKLSDQELNDILRREEMERRYDSYFNTPTEKKGAKLTKDALTVAKALGGIAVAGLTAAAMTITLVKGIRELQWDKNKSYGKPNKINGFNRVG